MSDIALAWDSLFLATDLTLVRDDLKTDEGLRTAILISLFSDRRAEPGDEIPAGDDLRGWWGDDFPSVGGDKIGSRLWLLSRSKDTANVLARAESYAREALQWLIDDLVAQSVTATATRLTEVRGYRLTIAVQRPGRETTTYQFDRVWDAEERIA